VQVLEASAAVWRGFDHLFLVGMNAGAFPAEPAGRELFAEHEREAAYAAGLPIEPAGVWFAREASLLRLLVTATRRTLHVSYAYADAAGASQIPSAYFDEVVTRVAADTVGTPAVDASVGEASDAWAVERMPGSQIAPASLRDAWCAQDLGLLAAQQWSADAPDRRADAAVALAHLAADAEHRALVARVLHAAGVEHERRTARAALAAAGPSERAAAVRAWNGGVTSPDLRAALDARFADRVWSASQLETYGRCPFTFFVQTVLGVRGLEEPDEDMDGAKRGQLLHVCLDRLHSRLAADHGAEAFTSTVLPHAARLIPDLVRRALDEFEKTGRGGVRELRAYRERELAWLLEQYLAWEIAENEKPTRRATPRRRPLRTEVVFGMQGVPPVTLEHGGRTLRLRGRIDRVDALTDPEVAGWRYVVDHKTSDASLTPLGLYDEGAVLQLPLYLHALARLDADAPGVWGGAYQVVKDGGKRAAPLHPRSLTKGKVREGGTTTEQTAASRVHDAVDLALMHVDGVRRGEFPARIPTCSTSCPTFCDARDVCREDRASRGGPRR
jgi:RecB family exonuclease